MKTNRPVQYVSLGNREVYSLARKSPDSEPNRFQSTNDQHQVPAISEHAGYSTLRSAPEKSLKFVEAGKVVELDPKSSKPDERLVLQSQYNNSADDWIRQSRELKLGESIVFNKETKAWSVVNSSELSSHEQQRVQYSQIYDKQGCLVEAFNCEPLNTKSLAIMLATFGKHKKSVNINGTDYKKCGLKNLIQQVRDTQPSGLVGGSTRDQLNTLLDVMEGIISINRHSAPGWLQLAECMEADGEAEIDNKFYTKTEAINMALKLRPDWSEAWLELGVQLHHPRSDVHFIEFDGRPFTSFDANLKAIQCDPTNSSAWVNITLFLNPNLPESKISVGGQSYSAVDCLLRGLQLDPKNSYAWLNLALLAEQGAAAVDHDGREYGAKECLEKAVETDSTNHRAWSLLANHLHRTDETSVVKGGVVGWRDCFRAALRCPPESADFSKVFGNSIVLLEKGEELIYKNHENRLSKMTPIEGVMQALEVNPAYGIGWMNLGSLLIRGDAEPTENRVKINGTSVDAIDCLTLAMSTGLVTSHLWHNIAAAMGEGEAFEFGGEAYDRIDCMAKALEMGIDLASSWLFMAAELMDLNALTDPESINGSHPRLKGGASIDIGSKSYTALDCYLKALEKLLVDPTKKQLCAQAMIEVASNVVEGQSMVLLGKEYSRFDLVMESLHLDPASGASWKLLFSDDILSTGLEDNAHTQNITFNGELDEADRDHLTKLASLVFRYNDRPFLWHRMAQLLFIHSTVMEFEGNTYTHSRCLSNALRIDHTGSLLVSNLDVEPNFNDVDSVEEEGDQCRGALGRQEQDQRSSSKSRKILAKLLGPLPSLSSTDLVSAHMSDMKISSSPVIPDEISVLAASSKRMAIYQNDIERLPNSVSELSRFLRTPRKLKDMLALLEYSANFKQIIETTLINTLNTLPYIDDEKVKDAVAEVATSFSKMLTTLLTLISALQEVVEPYVFLDRRMDQLKSTINQLLRTSGDTSYRLKDVDPSIRSLIEIVVSKEAGAKDSKIGNTADAFIHSELNLKKFLSCYVEFKRVCKPFVEINDRINKIEFTDAQLKLAETEVLSQESFIDLIVQCAIRNQPLLISQLVEGNKSSPKTFDFCHEELLQWWQTGGGSDKVYNPITKRTVDKAFCYALFPQDIIAGGDAVWTETPVTIFDQLVEADNSEVNTASSDGEVGALMQYVSRTINAKSAEQASFDDSTHGVAEADNGRLLLYKQAAAKLLLSVHFKTEAAKTTEPAKRANLLQKSHQLHDWAFADDSSDYRLSVIEYGLQLCMKFDELELLDSTLKWIDERAENSNSQSARGARPIDELGNRDVRMYSYQFSSGQSLLSMAEKEYHSEQLINHIKQKLSAN